MAVMEEIQLQSVRRIPLEVTQDGDYTFQKLTRKDVTLRAHGFHKYPAKFIPQIPSWALGYDPTSPTKRILDPFCGSGTTLLEAGLAGADAVGVDINPLAVVISRAKTARIRASEMTCDKFLKSILAAAQKRTPELKKSFRKAVGEDCHGLHYTWSNWFRPEEVSQLVALRDAITDQKEPSCGLENLALASLSSVMKSCSYLNEDQIKVRYDASKSPAVPFEVFTKLFKSFTVTQREVTKELDLAGATIQCHVGTASALMLKDASFDRIITSPPYINAVDYTMAHKYNLFVLGLLPPAEFKDHCRTYIGVSERAVRVQDIAAAPTCRSARAQQVVAALIARDTPTARNRAFVVAQYFSEMEKALAEGFRVLAAKGIYVLVIGETNRICGLTVPTADIMEDIARACGFHTELGFFHTLANRSSMRLSRSDTGGSIARERIYVFRK
jgi:DNA modification methylase